MPFRVGIVALMHESNTFVSAPTTLAHFEQDLMAEGEAVREKLAGTHHEVGGFFAGLAAKGVEAVPVFGARALPYGTITAGAAGALVARLSSALDRAGPLDGLLVAPHGAAVAENAPDFDGLWLDLLRGRFPRPFPVLGTLDLHANVSPRMVDACDALVAYRTNPHLDQRDRGMEAARLMARTLRGEIRPVSAGSFLPLAVNIALQGTAESPCAELFAQAEVLRQDPAVLAVSVVLGFPYADVAEMGASVIVVADGDRALAADRAGDLARWWWARRDQFNCTLPSPAEAVARAARLDGPVCLLDVGDNVGGGSPADGTGLAHELHRQGVRPACVCLADPGAVAQASAAGVGATVRLAVGGKTDSRHGPPLEADFTVRGLFDGRFREPEPRHGGIAAFDQGPSAVVESCGGLTVLLTTRRMVPFSLHQLTSCGLRPEAFQVLVAKGVHAPVAAYAPVCRHLLRVGTPGVTAADLSGFAYHRRRRPMFPFEDQPGG